MAKNFLKSSLQDTTFNIIHQLGFRVLTFFLNAFVLRNIPQAVVGVMNVRLLLLESTILFLSREAFRRACLSKTTEHNWPQVINLLWLTVPLCWLMCVIFGWIWLYWLVPPDPAVTTHYKLGVWAVCISCLIEMAIEPIYLISQAFLFVKLKVLLHSGAIFARTIIFTVLVIWRPNAAVVAFSVAQVFSVFLLGTAYCSYFHSYMKDRQQNPTSPDDFPFKSLSDFLPHRVKNKSEFLDKKLCLLTWSFFKQGILKQVLTEGERYVMTLFQVLSFAEQGLYDIVNNLGSLAARFLFRPVEDSAYFYFSQMVHRDKPISEQNKLEMSECAAVLEELLRLVTSVGLVVVCFGQAYSRLALLLYGGSGLADGIAPILLRTHCFAILLLAINGTTECYAFAAMDSKRIDRYNYKMAVISVGFLAVSWLFTTLLGSVGFILANCCNMLARIVNSISFIQKRYLGTGYDPLKGLFPGRLFISSCVISAIITLISEAMYYESSKFIHFMVGFLCFAITGIIWMFEELESMKRCYRSVRKKSSKSE